MTRQEAVDLLVNRPAVFGWMLGFTKLSILHNTWIRSMVLSKDDKTLQSSRGTYKTTCVSVALTIIIILFPNKRTAFFRKTDGDTKEIIKQVTKMLQNPRTVYISQCIYGVPVKLVSSNMGEITTNLTTDLKGTAQLNGLGTGGSITGKHFDIIFTDDIVNVSDRVSRAERDRTKLFYQELQNIKNRDGRIFNSGTPWHAEDCFSIMPEADKYNCYHEEVKKIISDEQLAELKERMAPSLFAANYELRHIASDNMIFTEPEQGAAMATVHNGLAHLDSAYYGDDYTAFTIMSYHDGKYYVFGKMWRKHVEDCYETIVNLCNRCLCSKLYTEKNADKGMVARDLKNKGLRVVAYNEGTNKHIKIVTYLKAIWRDVIFVEDTDPEYIAQIVDYTEDAEHDDAPDSAACLARLLYRKATKRRIE